MRVGKTTLTIYQHHNVAIVCGLGTSSSPAMQLETHGNNTIIVFQYSVITALLMIAGYTFQICIIGLSDGVCTGYLPSSLLLHLNQNYYKYWLIIAN